MYIVKIIYTLCMQAVWGTLKRGVIETLHAQPALRLASA